MHVSFHLQFQNVALHFWKMQCADSPERNKLKIFSGMWEEKRRSVWVVREMKIEERREKYIKSSYSENRRSEEGGAAINIGGGGGQILVEYYIILSQFLLVYTIYILTKPAIKRQH